MAEGVRGVGFADLGGEHAGLPEPVRSAAGGAARGGRPAPSAPVQLRPPARYTRIGLSCHSLRVRPLGTEPEYALHDLIRMLTISKPHVPQ